MSDIPKEIVESFKTQINERLASPLTGSFTIAWLVWNYKFIVILFSENSVEKTFGLIQKISFPDLYSVGLNGFLYPLISALFYIFVLPYPASWAYSFTRISQKNLAKIKQTIDDETPMTIAESRGLRNELREKDSALDQAMTRSASEIEKLRTTLSSVQQKLAMYESVKANEFIPNSDHLALLIAISKDEFNLTRDELVEKMDLPGVDVDFMLTELQNNNLINTRPGLGGFLVYGLAQNGRRYLLRRVDQKRNDL